MLELTSGFVDGLAVVARVLPVTIHQPDMQALFVRH
jgi:hypothetical protein